MKRYAVAFLICLFCVPLLFSGSQYSLDYSLIAEKTSSLSYTPSGAIAITSDQDFIDQSWPGNGDPGDPYVIDGLNITSSGSYAIRISHTRKHFLVNNCYIPEDTVGSWTALWLNNISNGLFENIHVYDRGGYGFGIYSSTELIFRNITITSGNNRGLDISGCNNISILESNIESASQGLHMVSSNYCTFYDVNINSHHIELISSTHLNFTEVSTITYLSFPGYDIQFCTYSTFNRCVAYSGGAGFYMHTGSYENTFDSCIAYDNSLQNFLIEDCTNNTLQNCISYGNNNDGYNIENSNFTVFKNNTAYNNNRHGAWFQYSHNCSLYNNWFHDNSGTGIYMYYSNSTYMYATNASFNEDRGINFSWCYNVTIENCNTTENGDIGIYLRDGGLHSTIKWNNIKDCGSHGIYVNDGLDILIANNTVSNPSQEGITIYTCQNSVVQDNYIFFTSYGIYNYQSTYCHVRDNVITDSTYGLYDQNGNYMIYDNNNVTDALQGYRFYFGTNFSISNAFVWSSHIGYYIYQAESSNLSKIHATGCSDCGVYFYDCWNITISDSDISNNRDDDIFLEMSEECRFYSVSLGERGIRIESPEKNDWYHYFSDVTVDGRPLLYIVNETSQIYDGSSYGQVIMVNSTSCTVSKGNYRNHTVGIAAVFCTGGSLERINVNSSSNGIYLFESDYFTLIECTVQSCTYGTKIEMCLDLEVFYCSVNDTTYGFDFHTADNLYLQDSNATLCAVGVVLTNSDSYFIENCTFIECINNGLRITTSTNGGVKDIYIIGSSYGVDFSSLENCTASGVTITDSRRAMYLQTCVNVSVDHIAVTNATDYSIYFSSCLNSTISSAQLNGEGIRLYSAGFDGWNVTIDNCELNGKPIGQLRDTSGDIDASQYSQLFVHDCHDLDIYNSSFDVQTGLFLFNCENVTVHGITAEEVFGALRIVYSNYCYVYDWYFVNLTYFGIRLDHSDHIVLDHGYIRGNADSAIITSYSNYVNFTNSVVIDTETYGLHLSYSDYAYVVNNTFFDNYYGVYSYRSDYCQLFYNGFFNNSRGILVSSSVENSIVFNEFGNNYDWHAYDNGVTTAWDNKIDSGNAWDDYVSGGIYPITGSGGGSDNFPSTLGPTSPALSSPSDVNFFEGQIGNLISWSISGSYLQSYTLTRNGTIIQQGRVSSSLVMVYADGLVNGDYVYVLTVFNIMGQSDTDTVIVSILPVSTPDITPLADFGFYETKGPTLISWTATDLYPYEYEIYLDGEHVVSGEWNETIIVYYLPELSIGDHNITLLAFSECSNYATDTVWLTVLELSTPFINHPSDIEYIIGLTGFEITWYVSDTYPDTFELYRNGTLIDSGDWDGSDISLSLDTLDTTGVYNFTLKVFSASGESSYDTVMVTVFAPPTTPPTTTTTTTTTTGTTTTTTTTTGSTDTTTTSSTTTIENEGMVMLSIGLAGGLAVGILVSCIFTRVRKE